MQGPVLAARPGLEGRLIARHRGEVVPHPADHLLGLLHAAEAVRELGLVRPQLGLGQLGVLRVPAFCGLSVCCAYVPVPVLKRGKRPYLCA